MQSFCVMPRCAPLPGDSSKPTWVARTPQRSYCRWPFMFPAKVLCCSMLSNPPCWITAKEHSDRMQSILACCCCKNALRLICPVFILSAVALRLESVLRQSMRRQEVDNVKPESLSQCEVGGLSVVEVPAGLNWHKYLFSLFLFSFIFPPSCLPPFASWLTGRAALASCSGPLVLYSEFYGGDEVGKVLFDLNVCHAGLPARLPLNKSGSEVCSGWIHEDRTMPIKGVMAV